MNSGTIAAAGSGSDIKGRTALRLTHAPLHERWLAPVEVAQTSKLPVAERRAMADAMFAKAVEHLRASGIAFHLDRFCKPPVLVLDGGSSHPFDKHVAALRRMGAEIIYSPHALVDQDADGIIRVRQLFIGHEDLMALDTGALARLHEVVHFRTQKEIAAGMMTPYAGETYAWAGRLPPFIGGEYSTAQSFDEMRTHHYELRVMLRQLARDWPDGRRRVGSLLETMLRLTLLVSLRSYAIADAIAMRIATDADSIILSHSDDRIIASVSGRDGQDAFETKIPVGHGPLPAVGFSSLLSRHRKRRAELTQRLRDQLDWTKRTADGHVAVLRVLTQAFPMIIAGTPAEGRTALDAAIALLAERDFTRDRTLAAPTYEAMIDRYNDHIGRALTSRA